MSCMKDSIDSHDGALETAEALRCWIRSGVSEVLDDTPHNRFDSLGENRELRQAPSPSESIRQASPAGSKNGLRASQNARGSSPLDVSETSARALAEAATDLEALQAAMADFDGCALRRTATQLVFADGVPGSRVMFVGEAPGGEEDRSGRPFVGRAGQLLDRMLNAIGLKRQEVYVA